MLYESVDAMKRTNKVNLIGGTFTLAMTLAVASVGQKAWADDMTQAAPATEIVPATNGADVLELQAIFMDVQGKVRWRKSEDSAWTEAKVNDLLSAGAEIRTGLKSRSTLRVGKNATILVDSGTTFKLPEIVQDGQTLRTLATVKSGRADFKVDHVGFANDFKVVTPQTTLSVRGTGFALASGPLKGVDIAGANTNTINAIEVKYIAANMSYFVSGQGQTSSESGKQDPVQNAWASTIGPPPIAGTYASQSDVEQQVAQGVSGANPSSNTQQIQQTQASEANQGAIDTALVLAAEVSNNLTHTLTGANQGIETTSTEQLANFNGNFNVYESGDWQASLSNLDSLWFGSSLSGKDSFVGALVPGVNEQLSVMQNLALADFVTAQMKFDLLTFDSEHYFAQGVGEPDISELAFHDGNLMNGSVDSLLTLNQRWSGEEGSYLWFAEALNSSVQTKFANVDNAYKHLQSAQEAADNLGILNSFSQSNAGNLNVELAKMSVFLSDLRSLIGTSRSPQSMKALEIVSAFAVNSATQVTKGLRAASVALSNYENATSRGTRELFLAEARKYQAAVEIGLKSMAYLYGPLEGSEGPEGIAELAAKIQDRFDSANNNFNYNSFADYAQTKVDDVKIQSDLIQTLAGLSSLDAAQAEEELKEGGANKNAIDAQVSTMITQVNFMQSKAGMDYVDSSDGSIIKPGMAGFAFNSVMDLATSNLHKDQFDQLFAEGVSQPGLELDLGALRDLNSLYTGENSIQNQAFTVLNQITDHHSNAADAVSTINSLTLNYTTNLHNAESRVAESRASFSEQFSTSKAAADQYLTNFTTIVGANTTKVATDALAAVSNLVRDNNMYVDQAQAAVSAAENASNQAHSRGQMVFMNAVKAQMVLAAEIQVAANLSMLAVVTNGSAIQDNYSQARSDYNSLGGHDGGK